MVDAGYWGPNGGWVRAADRPPIKRRQISVRLPAELIDQAEKAAMRMSATTRFADVTLSDMVRRGLELAIAEAEVSQLESRSHCAYMESPSGRGLCPVCGSKEKGVCLNGK